MNRVNLREIAFNDDYSYTHQGVPFTGVAFELGAMGELVAETTFVDGVEHGPASEWYSSGVRRSERNLRFGALDGVSLEWFESGKLKRRKVSELGVCIENDEFDEDGGLVAQFKLTETDPNYRTLLLLRAKSWK